VDCVGVLLIREKAEELPDSSKRSTLAVTGREFVGRAMILAIQKENDDLLRIYDLLAATVESAELGRMKELATAAAEVAEGRRAADAEAKAGRSAAAAEGRKRSRKRSRDS
jgi:hypothetical protein